MNKIFLPVAMALMAAAPMTARTLTLDECVSEALEHNARVRTAEYSVNASRETSREAFTKYFPSVSASGIAFTANHGMLQHSFELPLSMIMPQLPDMDYKLSVLKKGSFAGINLLQPVFLGGRIVNGNRLAHVGEEVSRLQQRQTADEVRQEVEKYYWQLVSLHSKHRTVDAAINMLDTLTSQVQSYVDAGITTLNDLLEVKLKRNEMLVSRNELDNGITVMKLLLAQTVGMGVTDSIDVASEVPVGTVPPFPEDLYRNPAECLDQTVAHGLLRSNVQAKELEQKMALGSNLPTVAAGAGYNYEHLLDQSHTFVNVYVTVSIPLTDWWGGSHSMKKKALETKIARTQLEDNSQLLMVAMINAWNDLATAHSQMEISRESISQAEENLRLNRNFYEAGTTTISDLLKAQTLYQQARDSFSDAYGDFELKKLIYLQSTGR